mmetsp:Transcript_2462/g.3596  ORF Transcript_2462/g.3596 Transcript_2462/m.3596 type:complete len:818 (-) Transcript_2462:69-2522(-)
MRQITTLLKAVAIFAAIATFSYAAWDAVSPSTNAEKVDTFSPFLRSTSVMQRSDEVSNAVISASERILAEGGGHDDDEEDGHGGGHSDLSVHVTYEEIYQILVFLLVATGAGIIFELLGMPALVGEIVTGFILGPPLVNFVPYPEAMVLVGEIGLILLLLEAGVEIDVGQLKETGTRAISIAVVGSCLPLAVGFAIATAAGVETWKGALAVGAAFSPTSLGVAAKALGAGGMLNTPVGGLIVASCVIDDTIALIILAMFQVLVKDDPAIIEYFIPLISAIGFLIVLGGAAVFLWPNLIEKKLLPKFKKEYRETVMFTIMALLLIAYLPLLNYTRASYLSGAFLAGMSFSQIHSAHDSFIKHTHQLMIWLLRVFFAASIGFQIPIKKFGDPMIILWGFALYAAVAMKFPLGIFVPKFETTEKGASFNPKLRDFLVTSLAMSCRGEFSFIIASFGLSAGLIGEDLYSSVVFAVLLSCVTSPFVLLKTIKYFKEVKRVYLEGINPLKNGDTDGKMNLYVHIQIKSRVEWGMQEKFRKQLNELGLVTMEHTTEHDRGGVDSLVNTNIYARDNETHILLPTIEKQRAELKALQMLNDSGLGLSKKRNLSNNSLQDLIAAAGDLNEESEKTMNNETSDIIQRVQEERKVVNAREKEIKEAFEAVFPNGHAMVSCVDWNPWDWIEALKMMSGDAGGKVTREYLLDLFDRIDEDGGGTVDEEELFSALQDAGSQITRDGLRDMIAMVDENNDGEISRDEWKEAVDFFIEYQEAEGAMGGEELKSVTKSLMMDETAHATVDGTEHIQHSSDEEEEVPQVTYGEYDC